MVEIKKNLTILNSIFNPFIRNRLPEFIIKKLLKIYTKFLMIFSKSKIEETKSIFNQSSRTPEWLDLNILKRLQQNFTIRATFTYDEKSIEHRGKNRAFMINRLMLSERKRINKFLELGCGHGMVSYALHSMGKKVTGIDINLVVDKEYLNCGVSYLKMDATDLKFDDESFDCVFSFDSFEHFPNPEKVLKEALRVVKKEGYIYLSFGPLYMSPWGLHQYRLINIPYCQYLLPIQLLKKFAKKIKPEEPWIDPYLNEWPLENYRKLWVKYSDRIKKIELNEILDIRYLDLVKRYPSCFKSKTNNFDNLIISSIEVLFKKIK